MVQWQPVGSRQPKRSRAHRARPDTRVRSGGPTNFDVFLSYSHRAARDAEWVNGVLAGAGLRVWVDERGLSTGLSLPAQIEEAIAGAKYFVPLVDDEYLASEWCLREFQLAGKHKTPVMPINLNFGGIRIPARLQRVFELELGEPLMLDLRRSDAEENLWRFATSMAATI